MAKSPAGGGKVFVLGDVTLDWLEEAIPRTEWKDNKTRRNYELYNPGFQWTPLWGGAALLERLVKAAMTEFKCPYSVEPIDVPKLKNGTPKLEDADTRKYLQSLVLVRRMDDDDGPARKKAGDPEAALRVEHFKGFFSSLAEPKALGLPKPAQIGTRDCLVLDDAANSWRRQPDFSRELKALAAKAGRIVFKPSRPLDSEYLLNTFPGSKHDKRVVVVINVEDLRAQGVDISRRLSWERTAADIISASAQAPVFRDLSRLGDVMVRLGSDGCVLLQRHQGRKYLIFDPYGAENAFDEKLNGTMPGATSAFVAAVTARLLIDDDITPDTAHAALSAARRLLERGFERVGTDADGPLDYPRRIFDGSRTRDFATEELPERFRRNQSWSIVLERLEELRRRANQDPERNQSLPERIALEGPDAALRLDSRETAPRAPIVRYGKLTLVDRREVEGYRSIENLLGEYIKSTRGGLRKPLSIGVFGPPGSGKSFGIKEVAKSIDAKLIQPEEFNLTQLEKPSDLVGAFHIARDKALRGCVPLLIFDEFDCAFGGQPWGWLKYFLAPMQDGLFKDEALHPLGTAIFVFAGGTADSYSAFSRPKGKLKADFKAAKGPDFVSRLSGYVDVHGISKTRGDPACIVRRAVLLRSLLEKNDRTQNLFRVVGKEKFLQIDWKVLRALLTVDEYCHGARSLEAILGMSRFTNTDHFAAAALPSEAQLKLHVDQSFAKILRERTERPPGVLPAAKQLTKARDR